MLIVDWSDEQTISFIEMYRNLVSCGTQLIHYIKIETKGMMGLWKSPFLLVLKNVMQKKNNKNLQSQFSRERKNEKNSIKTGRDSDEKNTSKWFA